MNQIPEKFEPASVISSGISPGTDQAEKIRLILEQIRPGLTSRKVEVIPVEPYQAKVDPGAAIHSSPATIIDLSLGELLQKYPQELIGVDIDQNQVELDFLMEMQGIAWVDPGTYQIVRLKEFLQQPVPRISLAGMTSGYHDSSASV